MAHGNGATPHLKIVIGGTRRDQIERYIAAWQADFPNVDFILAQDEAAQVTAAPGADAWVGRISRAAFLASGPQIKWVHSTGAGIETLTTIRELVESDVILTNTRGGHAGSVADHAFALLLALTRRIPDTVRNQLDHSYKKPGNGMPLGELGGDTMVVVGFGHIGRAIARRAVAFDMRVIGVDVAPGPAPDSVDKIVGIDQLDEALSEADVVVVATPYTSASYRLFDAQRIGRIQRGGYLIAISRGGIVDEAALADALRNGHLAGAGLDVQEHEPLPTDDPLWDVPNLLLSPHCASSSRKTSERVWAITGENLRRFVEGRPLLNVCDKRAGY